MKLQLFIGLLIVSCCWSGIVNANDQDWFAVLYQKISDIVAPQQPLGSTGGTAGAVSIAPPHQLFLMEVPGLAIAREDFDPDVWAADGYRNRSPSYVLADFVDRAPRFTDVTFVDTGTKVSKLWNVLMTQYLVPVIDDPVQRAAVEAARERLWGENVTLEEDFNTAFEEYSEAFLASIDDRANCLAANPDGPEICTQTAVLAEQTVSVKWFGMETRRRDLLGAQAAVLALQMMDLKTLYAEALQKFSRSKRVDVGAISYGDEFYQTYANPSDFWQWWTFTPNYYSFFAGQFAGPQWFNWADVGTGDNLPEIYNGNQDPAVNGSFPEISNVNATGFTFTPSGVGTTSFDVEDQITTRVHRFTVMVSPTTSAAQDAAFSALSWSQSSYSNTASMSTSSLSVSASVRVRYGLFSGSGNFNYGTSSSSSASSSATSNSNTAFEVAKVNVVRPWLDSNLLTFKPVAIRGVNPGGWSRGPAFPTAANSGLRFPLLPTAFIVVRNVDFTMSFSSSFASAMASSTSYSAKVRVSYGPFFSGSSSVSSSKSSARAASGGSASGSSLTIPGPQVVGWVCTVLPYFPTASSNAMEKMNFGQVLTNTFTQSG